MGLVKNKHRATATELEPVARSRKLGAKSTANAVHKRNLVPSTVYADAVDHAAGEVAGSIRITSLGRTGRIFRKKAGIIGA